MNNSLHFTKFIVSPIAQRYRKMLHDPTQKTNLIGELTHFYHYYIFGHEGNLGKTDPNLTDFLKEKVHFPIVSVEDCELGSYADALFSYGDQDDREKIFFLLKDDRIYENVPDEYKEEFLASHIAVLHKKYKFKMLESYFTTADSKHLQLMRDEEARAMIHQCESTKAYRLLTEMRDVHIFSSFGKLSKEKFKGVTRLVVPIDTPLFVLPTRNITMKIFGFDCKTSPYTSAYDLETMYLRSSVSEFRFSVPISHNIYSEGHHFDGEESGNEVTTKLIVRVLYFPVKEIIETSATGESNPDEKYEKEKPRKSITEWFWNGRLIPQATSDLYFLRAPKTSAVPIECFQKRIKVSVFVDSCFGVSRTKTHLDTANEFYEIISSAFSENERNKKQKLYKEKAGKVRKDFIKWVKYCHTKYDKSEKLNGKGIKVGDNTHFESAEYDNKEYKIKDKVCIPIAKNKIPDFGWINSIYTNKDQQIIVSVLKFDIGISENDIDPHYLDHKDKRFRKVPLHKLDICSEGKWAEYVSKKNQSMGSKLLIDEVEIDDQVDEYTFCHICFSAKIMKPDNEIVYCDGCLSPVHMKCYGITLEETEEDEWFCNVCREPDLNRTINKTLLAGQQIKNISVKLLDQNGQLTKDRTPKLTIIVEKEGPGGWKEEMRKANITAYKPGEYWYQGVNAGEPGIYKISFCVSNLEDIKTDDYFIKVVPGIPHHFETSDISTNGVYRLGETVPPINLTCVDTHGNNIQFIQGYPPPVKLRCKGMKITFDHVINSSGEIEIQNMILRGSCEPNGKKIKIDVIIGRKRTKQKSAGYQYTKYSAITMCVRPGSPHKMEIDCDSFSETARNYNDDFLKPMQIKVLDKMNNVTPLDDNYSVVLTGNCIDTVKKKIDIGSVTIDFRDEQKRLNIHANGLSTLKTEISVSLYQDENVIMEKSFPLSVYPVWDSTRSKIFVLGEKNNSEIITQGKSEILQIVAGTSVSLGVQFELDENIYEKYTPTYSWKGEVSDSMESDMFILPIYTAPERVGKHMETMSIPEIDLQKDISIIVTHNEPRSLMITNPDEVNLETEFSVMVQLIDKYENPIGFNRYITDIQALRFNLEGERRNSFSCLSITLASPTKIQANLIIHESKIRLPKEFTCNLDQFKGNFYMKVGPGEPTKCLVNAGVGLLSFDNGQKVDLLFSVVDKFGNCCNCDCKFQISSPLITGDKILKRSKNSELKIEQNLKRMSKEGTYNLDIQVQITSTKKVITNSIPVDIKFTNIVSSIKFREGCDRFTADQKLDMEVFFKTENLEPLTIENMNQSIIIDIMPELKFETEFKDGTLRIFTETPLEKAGGYKIVLKYTDKRPFFSKFNLQPLTESETFEVRALEPASICVEDIRKRKNEEIKLDVVTNEISEEKRTLAKNLTLYFTDVFGNPVEGVGSTEIRTKLSSSDIDTLPELIESRFIFNRRKCIIKTLAIKPRSGRGRGTVELKFEGIAHSIPCSSHIFQFSFDDDSERQAAEKRKSILREELKGRRTVLEEARKSVEAKQRDLEYCVKTIERSMRTITKNFDDIEEINAYIEELTQKRDEMKNNYASNARQLKIDEGDRYIRNSLNIYKEIKRQNINTIGLFHEKVFCSDERNAKLLSYYLGSYLNLLIVSSNEDEDRCRNIINREAGSLDIINLENVISYQGEVDRTGMFTEKYIVKPSISKYLDKFRAEYGFIGFAVNLIQVKPEDFYLKKTVAWDRFKNTMVFEHFQGGREARQFCKSVLKTPLPSFISLDGGRMQGAITKSNFLMNRSPPIIIGELDKMEIPGIREIEGEIQNAKRILKLMEEHIELQKSFSFLQNEYHEKQRVESPEIEKIERELDLFSDIRQTRVVSNKRRLTMVPNSSSKKRRVE
eukprot:TRINITY_DN9223_c0_g1_i1.p1 TRINITY_DN9223_c0_g1~~TRINITY_DN9223_c0_g1_i1.p1  ORF type:complete len:2121 (-),score=399.89 TRINITY_DN9223_c0_g1_i1:18-5657(-)